MNKKVEISAPAPLEVVLTEQEERMIVHLINHHGNRPVDDSNVCVEHVLPVHNVTVYLPCKELPNTVILEPEGLSLDWVVEDGLLTVQVPAVVIHSMVVVE